MNDIYEIKGELGIAVVLLGLLFVVFNPWDIAMPSYVVMSLLVGLVVIFIAFASFVWRESQGDERERFHRSFADRAAYLAGSAFLLVAIVVEELSHNLDPWIVLVLAIMVFGKIIGLTYAKKKL